MAVFHIVARKFTMVDFQFLGQVVFNVLFLQHGVTAVLFIP